MPLDVLGRTRATLTTSTSLSPWLRSLGNLLKGRRDGDWGLQLSPINEEFLVNASHQLALITSLPFVHTARRSYRLDESMSHLEIVSEAFGWNLRSKFCKSVHLEEGEVVTRFP